MKKIRDFQPGLHCYNMQYVNTELSWMTHFVTWGKSTHFSYTYTSNIVNLSLNVFLCHYVPEQEEKKNSKCTLKLLSATKTWHINLS